MMPVYRFQMPDGRIGRVQANSPEEAKAFVAKGGMASSPPAPTAPSGPKGASQGASRSPADQATYLKELAADRAANARGPLSDTNPVTAFIGGATAPFVPAAYAALKAGGNTLANLTRSPADQVSSRAIWDAARDSANEDIQRQTKGRPITTAAGGVMGLLGASAPAVKGIGLLGGLASKAPVVGEGMAAAAQTAARLKAAAQASPAGQFVADAVKSLNPKVINWAAKTGQAALAGGGAGAALGASRGTNVPERAQNALDEGMAGAGAGGLLRGLGGPAWTMVGAPLVKAAGGAGADVLRGLGNIVMAEDSKFGSGASARDAAKRAAARIAKSSGTTAANLDAKIAPYAGLDQTAAEAMGTTGQRFLGALARRQGTTGDTLQAQMRLRAQGQPTGILQDFGDKLGVDPQAAQGNIDALVQQGKDAAGPAFRQAYEASAGGIDDPEVNRLLATPMGQRLMRGIQKRALNIGRPAEALGYGNVEVPQEGVQVPPGGYEGAAPPPPAAPRGPAKPPSQGLSLTQWLSRQGGMSNAGQDIAPEEVAQWRRPGFSLAAKDSGFSDDRLAEMAHDAGYFPDLPEPPTPEAFRKALALDATGYRKLYARPVDQAAQGRFDALNAHEEGAARGAFEPPAPTEDDYGNGPGLPDMEPAYQLNLTGESLDRIRRRANKMVTWENGRPVTTGPVGVANEEPAAWAQDFTKALAGDPGSAGGAVPGLRQALDTSSDYLGLQSAQNALKGKLTTGSVRDFAKAWQGLKPGGEQLAGQAQLANEVMDLWGRGQLRGGKFAAPGVGQKIKMAFGDGPGQDFIDQMERRAQLAASGSRMAPFSGSPTMSLAEASGEVDNAGAPLMSDAMNAGGKLLTGHPIQAAGVILKKLPAYLKTAGESEAYRNELGRLLSLPSDDPEFRSILDSVKYQPTTYPSVSPVVGAYAGSRSGNGQ
jgi:hypothetical protein